MTEGFADQSVERIGEHDKRSFTSVVGDCTAVCKDDLFNDCTVDCPPTPTAKAVLQKRSVVTVTNDGCTAVCWDMMPGTECDVQCSGGFATHMPLPTSTSKALMDMKILTTINDGCTAVCWNSNPGTGCDVQCHDTSITKMPAATSGVSSMWKTTFTSNGCTFTCQDLFPGSECGITCPASASQTAGALPMFLYPVPRHNDAFSLYSSEDTDDKW